MAGSAQGKDQGDRLFDGGPAVRLQEALHLLTPADQHLARRAIILGLLGWVPIAAFALAEGTLWSFLTDYGTYGRLLIAVPLFVWAEADCTPRLDRVVRQFMRAGLITDTTRPRYEAAIKSTRRLRDSRLGEVAAIVLAYLVVFALAKYVAPQAVVTWLWNSSGSFSLAGWWHALVSLPILLILIFGWLFRIILWARFLWLMSKIELRLIPSHPDHCGGLMFVSSSIRGFRLVAFALGSIVAGTVANHVIRERASPLDFKNVAIGLAGVVVVLVVGPLTAFITHLRDAKRDAMYSYGALAGFVGRQFEQRWLDSPAKKSEGSMEVNDFSATTDLYQVVSNIYKMQDVPFGMKPVLLLVASTLIPFIPVALIHFPLQVVLEEIAKLLL